MSSNLSAGAPGVHGPGKALVELYLSHEEQTSIWIFIERDRRDYPILVRFSQDLYGPKGDFELDSLGQDGLQDEIRKLREKINQEMSSPSAMRRVAQWIENERVNGTNFKVEGLSPQSALVGLKRVGEFVHQAKKNGWLVWGETD